MSQTTMRQAPARYFSKGPYAATTGFEESVDYSAAVWTSGVLDSSRREKGRKDAGGGWLTSPIATMGIAAVSMLSSAESAYILAASVESVPSSRTPLPKVHGEEEADTESRPWRGVFVVASEREVLFTHEVELRTAELPEWEPEIILNRRWLSTEDE